VGVWFCMMVATFGLEAECSLPDGGGLFAGIWGEGS